MKYINFDGDKVLGIYDHEIHSSIPEPNFAIDDDVWQAFLADQSTYKVMEGQLVFAPVIPSDEEMRERKLAAIRAQRDALLSAADKYMMPDYPITPAKMEEVKVYRQALRDLPDQTGLDLDNPAWPILEGF
ncbi:MAG: tail fiber assembly protein [Negativicutes bacterium]|nr:tail fiber assembly protein [Negativicutes bacterium]